jgi:xanthine dehydrogenase accessory factor
MSIDNSDTEVLQQAIQWLDAGHPVELITVARTFGSSPRPPGSLAAVRADGTLIGSVSGGCIEKQLALRIDEDARAQSFAHEISDDEARKFGLPCGGKIELIFEALSQASELKAVLEAIHARKRIARTLQLNSGTTKIEEVDRTTEFHYDGQSIRKVFGPGWRVLLIGGGQLSRFVAQFAQALDYEVVVCEPRREFAAAWNVDNSTLTEALPEDAVSEYATDHHSIVLALTHDPNLDDSALIEALPSNAFYVGALGSKANNDRRRKRLIDIGVEKDAVARLHGPVGLDIGSRSAAEIAIAIMAEIVQIRSAPDRALRTPR